MSVTDIIRDVNALEPKMVGRANLFLSKVSAAGIKIGITETRRTHERQVYLYAQGRTRPGKIVTWTLQSNHILGLAFDVVFMVNGKATYEGDWERIGKIGESCGLAWGGRWKTPDRPHFEFNPNITNDMIPDNKPQAPVPPQEPEKWALDAEAFLIEKGLVNDKKDLNAPLPRKEFYVIMQRLLEKQSQ